MVHQSFEIFFVFCLGLVLGSFASAMIWRVPRGISWVMVKKGRAKRFVRSECPYCYKTLQIKDLIPLFSWLLLKGKCRYCNVSIGVRYPLTELATLLGCFGVYLVWAFTIPAFIIMLAIPLLVALLAIDLEHMILPNQLVLLLGILALFLIVYQWLGYGFDFGFDKQAFLKVTGMAVFAFTAWGVGRAVEFFLKKEALGMGDIKFFAVAGLWLGVTYLPFFLIFSGFIGLLIGLAYSFFLKKQRFPFGPALIIALYVGLLLQGLEIVPLIGVQ